jgi:hypothetical protein
VIVLLFAMFKVPEMVTPLRRINVSLQAGMAIAIAVVRTHASRADLVLIIKVIFMHGPLFEKQAD